MQLPLARLCLDCEEVHEEYQCPVCASDHFTYLSRWVPAPERHRPRPVPKPSPELETYRQLARGTPPPKRSRMFTSTLVGLGAAGLAGLFFGARRARASGASDDSGKSDKGEP